MQYILLLALGLMGCFTAPEDGANGGSSSFDVNAKFVSLDLAEECPKSSYYHPGLTPTRWDAYLVLEGQTVPFRLRWVNTNGLHGWNICEEGRSGTMEIYYQ